MEKYSTKSLFVDPIGGVVRYNEVEPMIRRLREYEDLDMTPTAIRRLLDDYEILVRESVALKDAYNTLLKKVEKTEGSSVVMETSVELDIPDDFECSDVEKMTDILKKAFGLGLELGINVLSDA